MHIWCSTIYIKIIGDAAGLLIAEQLTELVGGSISTEASFSKHSEEAGDGFGLVDFEQAVALDVLDEGLLGHRGIVEFDDVVTR